MSEEDTFWSETVITPILRKEASSMKITTVLTGKWGEVERQFAWELKVTYRGLGLGLSLNLHYWVIGFAWRWRATDKRVGIYLGPLGLTIVHFTDNEREG